MALGGGKFVTQNKVLPGAYINFVSASKATANVSDRGVCALPLPMSWGISGKVFTVTNEEFQKDSLKLFGYAYTADELKGLRELFQNVKACHFYNVNSGGVKASNTYATAKYPGTRGNKIMIVISENENSGDDGDLFDVQTFFDGTLIDEQFGLSAGSELKENDCVTFNDTALSVTAGEYLSNGTDGTISDGNYQTFLDLIESYSFNTIGCLSSNDTVKGLFATWTKRMRDEVGVKFQCILHKYAKADYEGVISVENDCVNGEGSPLSGDSVTGIVYWLTGAEAGCEVNKSLTNMTYKGDFSLDTDFTQTELADASTAGKLMFHRVGEEIRVLEDVNTHTTHTEEKSSDFSNNQTIRVLDQIANDIGNLFANKYLGKIANDGAGRISLWNDIVKHHQTLEGLRAIENFSPDSLVVMQGDTKKSVKVIDTVTPVNAMAQLYMTVIVQ